MEPPIKTISDIEYIVCSFPNTSIIIASFLVSVNFENSSKDKLFFFIKEEISFTLAICLGAIINFKFVNF